ncbi:MAG: Permease of the major facilitator superfamily [Bacteroidota bacterium]|jgi:MFS family permease|nr:Permease of the major facilitator superfamily [Bacteroidota bacterium]
MSFSSSLQILRHKEFRWFVLARFFLTLAIQMQFSTIYLQVYYEYSKEEFMLGMIGLAEAVPFIITSFYSGYLADIINRKKILMTGCFALFFGSLFLFGLSTSYFDALKNTGIAALFGVIFVFGIIRSFLAVSTTPFMSQIVPRELYTQSATWNSTAWHIGSILGPVISGILFGYKNAYHPDWCYATTCVLFLFAFLFYALIKNRPVTSQKGNESFRQSMLAGVRFVFKNNLVLSALSLDLFAVLFGGAIALIPAFTDKILHLGPDAYGLLRTAPAVGALLMAFYLTFKTPARFAGISLLLGVAGFGLFTIFFALCTNYWLAFLMLLCTGAFDNISVVIRHSILQLATPDEMRGRVAAVNSIFIGSSNEIGAFESGVAARFMGLVPSIIFGGSMTILTVLGINKLNPELKKLDLTKLH